MYFKILKCNFILKLLLERNLLKIKKTVMTNLITFGIAKNYLYTNYLNVEPSLENKPYTLKYERTFLSIKYGYTSSDKHAMEIRKENNFLTKSFKKLANFNILKNGYLHCLNVLHKKKSGLFSKIKRFSVLMHFNKTIKSIFLYHKKKKFNFFLEQFMLKLFQVKTLKMCKYLKTVLKRAFLNGIFKVLKKSNSTYKVTILK